MDSEDGHLFVKNLASFVRTHEKAIANALQLQRNSSRKGSAAASHVAATHLTPSPPSSRTANIAAALSLSSFTFSSPQNIKPVKLTLTPHHLFYLLSRFEELGVAVGPMNVRLENIHADAPPAEYVSFLSQAQRKKARHSDHDSIHSVSSLRSVMSSMTSFWSSFGLSSRSSAKSEKQIAALKEDMRYLYSAFTKIPCLKLAPDHKARLIAGYEEFPFDTAVPLFAFKNLSALEICDVDFRHFYGWDRMADQLRSLTVRHASLDDPTDLLFNIVLDDMDRRRRKASKAPGSPTTPLPSASPRAKQADFARYSPEAVDVPPGLMRASTELKNHAEGFLNGSPDTKINIPVRPRSASPPRPVSSKHSTHYSRASISQLRRSSGSSGSSVKSNTPRGSTSNLLTLGFLPPSKWRFLRHLSIADNALTTLSVNSLAPVASTLQSLDISSNLFQEIPESLASLTQLKALNMSDCMIDSLRSLTRNPLPAVTTLNLKKNRLASLAGVERLLSLQRVDFRDNKLADPTEMARLTGIPEIQEVFVNRNPFTKTHSNYRITIFNVFRAVPGRTEDIVIDMQPPSYGERKHLTGHAPEPISIPVVKPPLDEDVDTLPPVRPTIAVVIPDDDRASVSEAFNAVASQRRRKGAKRRIVELAKQQEELEAPDGHSSLARGEAPQLPAIDGPLTPLDPIPLPAHTPERPQLHTAQTQPSPVTSRESKLDADANPNVSIVPTRSITEIALPATNDTYRQRIESLRNDLGPDWLSALTDESWDSAPLPHGAPLPHTAAIPPALRVRTQSQSMVTTGRTLG